MVMTDNIKYIRYVSNHIHTSIDEIFNGLETARATSTPFPFPLKFFLDVDFKNKIKDLVYHRDEILKPHLVLCKSLNIPKGELDHVCYLYESLVDIEYKSFIQVMRVNKPWYGYSKDHKKKLNDLAINLLNDIIN